MIFEETNTNGGGHLPPSTGFNSNVLPDVLDPPTEKNTPEGVSTHYASAVTPAPRHWYAIRATYGRERKAYEQALLLGFEAFYPTLTRMKLVDGKPRKVTESRIPNLFFINGTEAEISDFVFHNHEVPFIRFYYNHHHAADEASPKEPLIIPDRQMETLRIVCEAEGNSDVIMTSDMVVKFQQGQLVRVSDGRFKGVVGRVARYQGQQRVGIVIEGLLTVTTAYIPKAFLEEVAE